MKRVVSDATPIRYLVEIGEINVLPRLFGKVFIPTAVLRELRHSCTPEIVHKFMLSSPDWLEVKAVGNMGQDQGLSSLDSGEREAILLTDEIGAEGVLLDERAARNAADQRGVRCIGTLRVLSEAAKQGHIEIHEAIGRLKRTTFRAHPALFERAIT
ncbi:MAG: hypothetical protein LGR52_08040, partial [Candidatus Thiosymbion ectosymbiont of Robbea hypermnestra]|nr:hypothetical protein [Candidatus Thiosymbion ectosymbiont of Robbea hypermnestra]